MQFLEHTYNAWREQVWVVHSCEWAATLLLEGFASNSLDKLSLTRFFATQRRADYSRVSSQTFIINIDNK